MSQQPENPTSTTESQGVGSVTQLMWTSLRDFTIGLLRRWWFWLLPTLLLTPFDLIERLTNIEWDPPAEVMWSIFGFSLFVAAWLTYREVWVDSRANRLGMLLRLKREGERFVGILDFSIQFAAEAGGQMQGEEQFAADIREGQIKRWLESVRDELTAGEINTFDGDQLRGSVYDIDIDLFTDLRGLRLYLAERVSRLDDICEGIRFGS